MNNLSITCLILISTFSSALMASEIRVIEFNYANCFGSLTDNVHYINDMLDQEITDECEKSRVIKKSINITQGSNTCVNAKVTTAIDCNI